MKLAWSIETPVSDDLPRQNEAIPIGATVPSIALVRDASATARTSVVDTQAWKAHLSLEEARFLAALVQVSEPGRPIVELGTLFGFTTIVLVLAKPRSQPLITVDGFAWNPSGLAPDEHYAATRSRLASAIAGENVSLRRSAIEPFLRGYAGEAPALVFRDCRDGSQDWERARSDLAWARSIGAAIVCGNGYSPRDEGVARAVDELGGPRKVVGSVFLL